jgi:uracil-DNA glycosylase
MSLKILQDKVASCKDCDLHKTRTQTVFSRGNSEAKLVIIGEAPGADEDAQGLPFVGKSGQLLDKVIGALGYDPTKDIYVMNVIKCRPPDNRKPTDHEVDSCSYHFDKQLELVAPKVIVCLGNTAAQHLLKTKEGVTKLRVSQNVFSYRGILVKATYHPSYLLRSGGNASPYFKDFVSDLKNALESVK